MSLPRHLWVVSDKRNRPAGQAVPQTTSGCVSAEGVLARSSRNSLRARVANDRRRVQASSSARRLLK